MVGSVPEWSIGLVLNPASSGRVAEWLMALVLKTNVSARIS